MAPTATARSAPTRSRSRPAAAPQRRRSGADHARPARPKAAPRPRRAARPGAIRFLETRTNGLLDRLLRGRLWVGCIGALLAGIVFLNVSLLELNQEIARTAKQAGALDRQNANLRLKLAGLDSTERIQRIATRQGMVFPSAGDYRYLTAGSGDGALAASRATAPRPTPTTVAAAPTATVAPQVPVTLLRPTTPRTTTGPTGAYRPQATGTQTTPSYAAPSRTTPPTAATTVAPHP